MGQDGGRMLSTHPCDTTAPGGISGVPPAKRGTPLLPLGSFGWLLEAPHPSPPPSSGSPWLLRAAVGRKEVTKGTF